MQNIEIKLKSDYFIVLLFLLLSRTMATAAEPENYDCQIPVICDQCEGHQKVNSYCLDCKANICDKCKDKRLHREHKLLPRTHPKVAKARHLAKQLCKEHPGNSYMTFCNKCHIPCCAVCITNKHNQHNFSDIEHAADDAREDLKSYIGTLEGTVLQRSESNLKTFVDGMDKYEKSTDDVIGKSRHRFQSLRDQLDRVESEWMQNINDMKIRDMKDMERGKRDIETKIKQTKDMISECKSRLVEDGDIDLLFFNSERPDVSRFLAEKESIPSFLEFQPSNFTLPMVSKLIGIVARGGKRYIEMSKIEFADKSRTSDEQKMSGKDRDIEGSIEKINLKTTSNRHDEQGATGIGDRQTKITDLASESESPSGKAMRSRYSKGCQNIDASSTSRRSEETVGNTYVLKTIDNARNYLLLNAGKSEMWLGDKFNKVINVFKEDTRKKVRTIKLDDIIEDMTLTHSMTVIGTHFNGQRLVRISNSGKISTLFSTKPLNPWGICVNDKEQIVVGLASMQSTFPRKLSVFSSDGSTVLLTIEKDKIGKSLFTADIRQVKQNGNGDYIAVHDGLSCVRKNGDFRWRYWKGLVINCLVCDRHSNVIIAEDNRRITLLDRDGNMVRMLLGKEDGIKRPLSMSIDKNGDLWIGQEKNVKIVKYLK